VVPCAVTEYLNMYVVPCAESLNLWFRVLLLSP